MERKQQEANQVIDKLRSMSASALDQYIESVGVLVCDAYKNHLTFETVVLKGGWLVRSSKPKVDTLPSVLFIAPSDRRTTKIWRKCQINRAIRAGLTHAQARRWINSKFPHRHATIDLTGKIAASSTLLPIYLAFESVSTKEECSKWEEENWIADGMSFSRRHHYIRHLRTVFDLHDANSS